MVSSNLSEQQELLLLKACKDNGGVLSMKMAEGMYSSKSSAKSAVKKLKLFDYISLSTPGRFRVEKLPPDLKREIESLDE